MPERTMRRFSTGCITERRSRAGWLDFARTGAPHPGLPRGDGGHRRSGGVPGVDLAWAPGGGGLQRISARTSPAGAGSRKMQIDACMPYVCIQIFGRPRAPGGLSRLSRRIRHTDRDGRPVAPPASPLPAAVARRAQRRGTRGLERPGTRMPVTWRGAVSVSGCPVRPRQLPATPCSSPAPPACSNALGIAEKPRGHHRRRDRAFARGALRGAAMNRCAGPPWDVSSSNRPSV